MQPSTFKLFDALTSTGVGTPLHRIHGFGAPARWICYGCSTRLQTRRRPKSKDHSIGSISVQYHPNHEQQPSEHAHPIDQRRAQSGRASNAASKVREDLPSQKEGQRSNVAKRFSHVMDHLQSNIFVAGQRLNDLTGYSGIEALKKDIERQEEHVQFTRKALQAAREAYSTAIGQRSSSQRKVNELLQRKHNWNPQDLEQFTALYRSDHANEQAESVAQVNLVKMEREAEEAAANLSASILARYHEEQIWSDKIRRMSTWGTWGLMGVNVFLFLVFQIGVEPWRRNRLVKGFEDKVMEALEREGSGTVHDLQASHAEQTSKDSSSVPLPIADEVSDIPKPKTGTALLVNDSNPSENVLVELGARNTLSQDEEHYRYGFKELGGAFRDLFSSRQVILRRVDVTALALEAAGVGMVVATGILMLLRPR